VSARADVAPGGVWLEAGSFNSSFVLSANTAVTFSAPATVGNSVAVPEWSVIREPGQSPQNGYFDWAPIQAQAQAFLYIGSGPSADTNWAAICGPMNRATPAIPNS
jgi:hypothetical protein